MGRATHFGLAGPYREVDDLGSGWFRWQADYGISRAAEGLDASGRWRMDASRRFHALDSIEAKTVALTEAYIARRGYARLERYRRALRSPSQGQDGRYTIVPVAPSGGRAASLYICNADRRIHRIDLRIGERTKSIRYDDYRVVAGVALPFSIVVDDGDEPDTAHIVVSSYRFVSRVDPRAFAPPAQRLWDAQLSPGSVARVPMRADGTTTGFAVVSVAINGHEPLPFIFDTGGHDIVTPAVARRLRLTVVGAGASSGAGAGSTRTAFTFVKSVSLGGATILDQPFVVLYEDLGSVSDVHGRTIAIAGILGLEFFERFTCTLDFMNGDLELRPRLATFHAGKAALPLTFTSDEPLAKARVDGTFGSFAIDTGNSVGLILYNRWLVRSKVPGLRILSGTMDGDSVGGEVSFRHARAASLDLDTLRISDVPVLISDARTSSMSAPSEAGSIGIPPFAGLRVTLQYALGKLFLW